MRGRRYVIAAAAVLAIITTMLLLTDEPQVRAKEYFEKYVEKYKEGKSDTAKPKSTPSPTPKYLPTPTWVPPPIKDPFPALATATALPPIPEYNIPKKNLHKDYGIDFAPPLLIGFTRTWPLLLQAVVSYITAGWPADQIYVVENTGVQRANAQGKLTLQNPFYLNHAQLKKLGVNIIQTPVLMNFAQLQNFYIHLAHEHEWPHYFWSHMDVLVISYEDGLNDVTPAATDPAYKTVYELCLKDLKETTNSNQRWANRFYAYDHLTLVNREAYEEVGGWDTFIPYYMTDCDMHSRLLMHNWTQTDAKSGMVYDVNTVLEDLSMLYRNASSEPKFRDPNPPPPKKDENATKKRDVDNGKSNTQDLESRDENKDDSKNKPNTKTEVSLAYWRKLRDTAEGMGHYKHGDRGRNTWQLGQQGGVGEPFYYPARGVAEAIDVLTEAGKEVYRRKWGHRECNLISGAGLALEDQWLVDKDW